MNHGETKGAYSYFVSNTGYRFITKKKTYYSVAVPKPEGGRVYRSVGFIRLGEKKALRKATKLRNKIGKELWGKHWDRVRTEFNLLARLPKTLEPKFRVSYEGINHDLKREYYIHKLTTYSDYKSRTPIHKFIRVSITCHGRLTAWTIAKRKILQYHADVWEILQYIEKVSSIKV